MPHKTQFVSLLVLFALGAGGLIGCAPFRVDPTSSGVRLTIVNDTDSTVTMHDCKSASCKTFYETDTVLPGNSNPFDLNSEGLDQWYRVDGPALPGGRCFTYVLTKVVPPISVNASSGQVCNN